MKAPRLSIVFPYYRNPGMLALHYAEFATWSGALADSVEICIVDDGSPCERAEDVPRPHTGPSVRVWRVLEDKPWHQHAARNIGAHEARGDFLLLTDMDHLVRANLALACLEVKSRSRAWRIHRVDWPDGTPTLDRRGGPKPHPNTFLMSRKLFWQVGGYDEDFCGIYGTDGMFRSRLEAAAQVSMLKAPPIWRFTREGVADASTRDVARKDGRPANFRAEAAERKRKAGRAGQVLTLSMPYKEVS